MATMAAVPAESLECSICHEIYDEPKQLSCSHTYCQKCLAGLLDSNSKRNSLTCPVCRQITPLVSGDVSKLQTNFPIKSLVEDVKAAEKICTVCDKEMRMPAVAYCQTCGDYMCGTCLDIHGKWKKYKGHEVVDSKSIESGKVKVKQLCRKHPQEEMEWVCSTCKVSICFRCRMLYHNGPDHEVQEVVEIQKALNDEAKALQKEAEAKKKMINDHATLVDEERAKTTLIVDTKSAEITEALEESIRKLVQEKEELDAKLQEWKGVMMDEFQELKRFDHKMLKEISSACDQVTNDVAGFLEGDSLATHQRLCVELQELMRNAACDERRPRDITEQAEGIEFTRYPVLNDLKLGDINLRGERSTMAPPHPPRSLGSANTQWNLKKVRSFSTLGEGITDMAPGPDGTMAVCYQSGGVDIFTVDGLRGTVLEKKRIQSISVLSDDRYAAVEDNNKFYMYSSNSENIPTPDVDIKHCYWVSLRAGTWNELLIYHYDTKASKRRLSLYKADSGEFVQDFIQDNDGRISHDAVPKRMNSHDSSAYFLSTRTEFRSVKTIYMMNKSFEAVRRITIKGYQRRYKDTKTSYLSIPIAVDLEGDGVLIGWRAGHTDDNDGFATVELYTHDLRYIRTVLNAFELFGGDFKMDVFSTGEIAICDSRHMHIFDRC